MAKVDVNDTPSEDEEFDVVADAPQTDVDEANDAPQAGDTITPDNHDDAPEPEADEAPEKSAEPEAEEPTESTDDQPEPEVTPATVTTAPVGQAKAAGWRPSPRLWMEIGLLIVAVGLALLSWSFYSDKQNLSKQVVSLNANPQAAVQKQTDAIIASVAQLMQLPTGETPTVAAVSDAAAAKQQSSFFDSAQNGDKVLMYVKAGEAILYRPSTNKIILVAPLTFNSNSTSSTGTSSTSTTKTTH